MTTNNPASYQSAVHFRAPADFMSRVHGAARSKGLTAASYMRMAIIAALSRDGAIEPEQDAA